MNKSTKIVLVLFMMLPVVAFAQLTQSRELIWGFGTLVNALNLVVVGLALLAFFWGLVKFIFSQGNEAVKMEAKKIMGWGLVAMFIMLSVWGIVRFAQHELLPSGDFSPPVVPELPGPS